MSSRARWNGARWFDGDGRKLGLIALLKKARRQGALDRPIWMSRAQSRAPLALRLVAIRKPKPAIAETIARLKRKASKTLRTSRARQKARTIAPPPQDGRRRRAA